MTIIVVEEEEDTMSNATYWCTQSFIIFIAVGK
jgi:hypothetical protein